MSNFLFGPFELDPQRLELRRDGARLQLGARTCRVLLALVERAGRVVSPAELLSAAWPGVYVEEINIRVHIVALRKALSGVGRDVEITTIPREGYLLSASVSLARGAKAPAAPRQCPPKRLAQIVGRQDDLDHLGRLLSTHRIVTIIGTGGIGKTALALAATERLGDADADCAFVDFSTSVSSLHVTARIVEALKLEGTPNDVNAHILHALKPRKILLVFDNCEHVIEGVASIVVGLMNGTDGVSILATSREPLHIPGECVFSLEPLRCAPEGAPLTAESAVHYAANRMFVEAASLRANAFAINDSNASLLSEVCRRLDGIPLALELAAAAHDTMTIGELARRLDDRFAILTRGMRTALPRHRTLQAAIDWSYDALKPDQALLMRRLGVFPGRFTADDARAVAADGDLPAVLVHHGLADLTAKSLLTVDVSGETATFRFLETLRVYARLKLFESEDAATIPARFVDHTLVQLGAIRSFEESDPELKREYNEILDNWRAAHDWTTRTNDWLIALQLLDAGIDLCQTLNLKPEFVHRSGSTLGLVPPDVHDDAALQMEMNVCNRRAEMLIDMQPPCFVEMTEATASRCLDLAMRLNSVEQQMRALVSLTVAAQCAANREKIRVRTSQTYEFAQRVKKPEFMRTAHYLNGFDRYNNGDAHGALNELDNALVGAVAANSLKHAAFDHVPSVRIYRARALWARGEFLSSLDEIEEAHRSAMDGGHAPTLAFVAWGGRLMIYLWAGAVDRAAASAQLFEDLAREHSNPGWASYIPSMREAVERFSRGERSYGAGPFNWSPHVSSQADVMTSLHCAFHRPADLQRIDETPQHWCAPEHLRSAGEHHLAAGRPNDAEVFFRRALSLSISQRNAAWEIRATLSLALLRMQQEQFADARSLLDPMIHRFADPHLNADLVYATDLLSRLPA